MLTRQDIVGRQIAAVWQSPYREIKCSSAPFGVLKHSDLFVELSGGTLVQLLSTDYDDPDPLSAVANRPADLIAANFGAAAALHGCNALDATITEVLRPVYPWLSVVLVLDRRFGLGLYEFVEFGPLILPIEEAMNERPITFFEGWPYEPMRNY
jgi:hypothetical protein